MALKAGSDIYLCSSLRNRSVNERICRFLEEQQFTVYNPGRDTPQTASAPDIFAANCRAIENAGVIVAVLDYFGKDFGFEIGYARGLGKPLVGYCTGAVEKGSVMVLQAIPLIASTPDELLAAISQLRE